MARPTQDRFAPGWPCELAIGEGWLPIVYELDDELRRIAPTLRYLQIKEKFGGLRVYATGDAAPEVAAAIRAAEERAAVTCEVCGNAGTLHIVRGWRRTLCANDARACAAVEVADDGR